MQKYLFSFAFLQYALHEKIKLNQSKLFSAVEMDEERSCFVLKLLQMSWLLSQSSPAPCVCVAAPSNYGDRQVARSWRDTVHCGAAVRAAICLFKPPPLRPGPGPEEQLRCYLRPLFFCRIFLAGACKGFLICTT